MKAVCALNLKLFFFNLRPLKEIYLVFSGLYNLNAPGPSGTGGGWSGHGSSQTIK